MLLILAGVAISTLTGENGLLVKAQQAAYSIEAAKFMDEAALAYKELYIEKVQNGNYEVTEEEVLERLTEKDEYSETIKQVSTGTLSGITVDLVTSQDERASVGTGRTKTVKVTPQGLTESKYAEIDGKYYPISYSGGKIILGEALSEDPTAGGSVTYTLTATSSATAKATAECNQTAKTVTITGVADGNSDITISYGGKNATVYVKVEEVKLYGERVFLNGGNDITVKDSKQIYDKWKLFYIDNESNGYVHLIYGDYYPANVQTEIPTGTNATVFSPAHTDNYNNDNSNSNYGYSVNTRSTRMEILRYLKNNSNYAATNLDSSTPATTIEAGGYTSWIDLATALTGEGKALAGKSILVQGAPNITMFVNSWNEQGNTRLALDDSTTGVAGYNIRLDSAEPNSNINYGLNISKSDSLYFPYTNNNANNGNAGKAYGYWLASPSCCADDELCCLQCFNGDLLCQMSCGNYALCARPVVSIPKATFQEVFPDVSITKNTNN